MKTKVFFIVTVLLIANVFADSIQLYPTDDMYTDCGGENHNQTELFIVNEGSNDYETIMIKFDFDNIQPDQLQSATLHLHRFFACGGGGGVTNAKLYLITEDWNEINWDEHTHISYDESTEISFSFTGPTGGQDTWYEIDVTNFTNLWLLLNQPNFGFCIVAETGQHHSKFDSKESTNADYHPYLMMQTNTGSNDTNITQIPEIILSNYPNPFNPETTFYFKSTTHQRGKLSIYDLKGRHVNTIFNSDIPADTIHLINWDGTDKSGKTLPSGVYFYQLITDNNRVSRKLILKK